MIAAKDFLYISHLKKKKKSMIVVCTKIAVNERPSNEHET